MAVTVTALQCMCGNVQAKAGDALVTSMDRVSERLYKDLRETY